MEVYWCWGEYARRRAFCSRFALCLNLWVLLCSIRAFSGNAPPTRRGASYFWPGGITPLARSDKDCVSVAEVAPRSSDPVQSPAQSLVPLTVPTSLHPIGSLGFT
jgi:hypothetical protein